MQTIVCRAVLAATGAQAASGPCGSINSEARREFDRGMVDDKK